jgi:general secretion pathway protein D
MRLARGTALLLMAVLLTGCGARWAYRQGQTEARRGNWDLAVARLTRALQKDPTNLKYRLALENARVQASRYHVTVARKHLAAGEVDKAAEDLQIAANYDPGNEATANELSAVRDRIRVRVEEKRRLSDFSTMRSRAQAYSPMPVLSPRSTAPITLSFPNQSLEKVFETLGKLAGINILFDPDFRDKQVRVQISGVSFEEALEQLTLAHRLFYKVLDRNTLIIVPESQAKRRVYDDVLLRTFYIQDGEVKEIETLIKTTLGAQAKVVSSPTLGAINIVGTPDELAVAERIISANDKARGEVMVQVEILEINRDRAKDFGIQLSNYSASVTLAPTSDDDVDDAGFTNVRAHLLSSLNLSDFVVSIPSSVLTSFLQTDSSVKILASPRLRAAEGKKTSLKIGTEVPVPVTTFTAQSVTPGTGSFAPATSFQYRNVGVNLELTPRVSAGGDISLELLAEFSLLGTPTPVAGQVLPTFLTRTVNGVLRVRDGETVLVGGLLQERETEALTGLLGLQSVPVLNKVFTNTTRRKEQTEILISLTPHLVRAPLILEADMRSMLVGTKEILRVSGARPPLFGPEDEAEGTVETGPVDGASPAPGVSPPPGAPLELPSEPETGRPAGTVSPPLGTPGTPGASPAPVPQVIPTPLPPPGAQPLAPSPSPSPAAGPTPAPQGLNGRPAGASLTPPQVRMRAGETSDLAVVVTNVTDLTQVEVVLGYDPKVVEVSDVRAGTLLTLDGGSVQVDQRGEGGRVRAMLRRTSGVSGSGMAAAVTFRAVAAGTSAVRVESLVLVTGAGSQGPPVAETAQITVQP